MPDFFENIIKNTATSLNYYIVGQYNQNKVKISKFLNPKIWVYNIVKVLKEWIKSWFKSEPSNLGDYFEIRNYYVAKKLIAIGLIGVIGLGVVFFKYVNPAIKGKFWMSSFKINSQELPMYTGGAKIFTLDSVMVYKGDVDKGQCTGNGLLYSKKGNLVYKGEFVSNLFKGVGEQYYDTGEIQFKGSFSDNKYNGPGTLFGSNGNKIYEGNFKDGVYDGLGKLYELDGKEKYSGTFKTGEYDGIGSLSVNGILAYKGAFKEGQFNGSGLLNDKDGKKIYEGVFDMNKYSGEGTLYYPSGIEKYVGGFKLGKFSGKGKSFGEDGKVLYEGTYEDNVYNGTGIEYFETGNKKYSGNYKLGLFDGQGSLYEIAGNTIYEGEFKDGLYHNDGKLYDPKKNILVYEGGFNHSLFNGKGKLYDTDSNRLVYEGEFKNGEYFGSGVLMNNVGLPVYSGNLYNGEIDYVSLVGMKADDVRIIFKNVERVDTGADYFTINYDDIGLSLVLNLATDTNPPVVQKVILWKNQNFNGITNGMSSDKIESTLGKYQKSGTKDMDAATIALLKNEIYIQQTMKYIDKTALNFLDYHIGKFDVCIYFNNFSDGALLYTIGGEGTCPVDHTQIN